MLKIIDIGMLQKKYGDWLPKDLELPEHGFIVEGDKESVRKCGLLLYKEIQVSEAKPMLSQAADDAEKLAKIEARLKAVVKECTTDFYLRCAGCPCEHSEGCELTCGQVEEIVNKRQKDILRAAIGEGGAK